MIEIWKEIVFRGLGVKILLQIHDELIFEVPDQEIAEFKDILYEKMQQQYNNIKIPVKISIGKSWGTLEEVKL